jgi:hypothetical protein
LFLSPLLLLEYQPRHLSILEDAINAFFGTMAQLPQEFAVAFQTDPQQDGDGEHKLSKRGGIEDVVGEVFPGLNRFFGTNVRAFDISTIMVGNTSVQPWFQKRSTRRNSKQ